MGGSVHVHTTKSPYALQHMRLACYYQHFYNTRRKMLWDKSGSSRNGRTPREKRMERLAGASIHACTIQVQFFLQYHGFRLILVRDFTVMQLECPISTQTTMYIFNSIY